MSPSPGADMVNKYKPPPTEPLPQGNQHPLSLSDKQLLSKFLARERSGGGGTKIASTQRVKNDEIHQAQTERVLGG